MNTFARGTWTIVIFSVLAACGGGGGGGTSSSVPSTPVILPVSTPVPSATAASTAAPLNQVSVALTITVPAASSSAAAARRKPAYIAPGTQSMTLALLQANGQAVTGNVQGPYNITSSNTANCTTNPQTGALTCTFSFDAPIGNDIFAANTYSGTNATGPLGSGSIAVTVQQNVRNVANISLTGPVASVQLFSDGASNLSGSSSARGAGTESARRQTLSGTSSRLFIIALDAAGNQIVNPTTFDIPLYLTLNTTSGLPAGAVALTDTYLFPGTGPASASTANPNPPYSTATTVMVTSPGDTLTLSITGAATGNGSAAVGLTYTPQAGPNAGQPQSVPTLPPVTVEAVAQQNLSVSTPVISTPYYANGFRWNQPSGSTISTAVNNISTATSAVVTFTLSLPSGITGTGSGAGWTCPGTPSQLVQCTSVNGIPASSSLPITITINSVSPTTTAASLDSTIIATPAGSTTSAYANVAFNVYGTLTATPQAPSASDHLQMLCFGSTSCDGGIFVTEGTAYAGTITGTVSGTANGNACSTLMSLPMATLTAPANFSVYPIAISGTYVPSNPSTYCTITFTDQDFALTGQSVTVNATVSGVLIAPLVIPTPTSPP